MSSYHVYNPIVVSSLDDNRVERIEASITLSPGTYWKCTTTPEEAHLKSRIEKDEVLLLVDVFDDEQGNAHSVSLLLTPERRSRTTSETIKLMINDFFDLFIHEPKGEQIRKQQVEIETQLLMGIQSDISSVQENPSNLIRLLMESDDTDLSESKSNIEGYLRLASRSHGNEIQAQSDALIAQDQLNAKKEIATTTGKVLQKITEKLTSQIELIGRYHSEVGHLALARTKESRILVEKVSTAIETLDMYLGKDVQIYSIKTGKGGDASDKYTLYQNMLYMDEESLIHAEGDGADYNDINLFFEKLSKDDKLISRIFPFERCIVIMRPRRKEMEYEGESPFEKARKSSMNRMSFILVRNGENINAIFHPLGFLQKMYPSQADLDNAFKTHSWADCRNITKDDLQYIQSLNEDEKLRRNYKRMVLMLQGVYDRDEEKRVFGDLPVNGPLNLLNPVHQGMAFNFVSMDSAIQDESRPSYSEWFSGINKHMRAGSLVYITKSHINEKNVPGIFSTSGGYTHCNWKISDPDFFTSAHVLEKHGNKIGIKAEFVTEWGEDKRRNFIIEVKPESKTAFDLSSIRPSDIDYYLESRKERVSYVSYIDLLLRLKSLALQEEARTEELRGTVRKILIDAGHSVNEDSLFSSVMRFIANDGLIVPDGDQDEESIHQILNLYWQITGGADHLNQKILNHFTSSKPEDCVICIAQDAKNESFVFTINKARNAAWDRTGFPWMTKYKLVNTDKLTFVEQSPCRITEIKGKLSFTYEHESISEILNQQNNLHSLTYRQVKNWHEKINNAVKSDTGVLMSVMNTVAEGIGITDDEADKLFEIIERQHDSIELKSKSNKRISIPLNIIPIGILGSDEHKHYSISIYFDARDMISAVLSLMNGNQLDTWKQKTMSLFKKIIGNERQGVDVINNASKYLEQLLPLNVYSIREPSEFTGGLFCAIQDKTSTPLRLDVIFSPNRYHGQNQACDVGQVHFLEPFIEKYPALSSKISRSFSFETQGRQDRISKKISIRDLSSEIAREVERVRGA